MNWLIILVETIIVTIIFTGVIFIPLCKNPVWWIHNYPNDIKEEYFKTHEQIPVDPLNKAVIIKKGIFLCGVIIITIGLMYLAGVQTFMEGFLGSFFYMVCS